MTAPSVVALGGNALLRRGDAGTVYDQLRRAEEATRPIAALVARGLALAITHGNGPVVGNIFLRHEQCGRDIPPMPLDVCGAESQGKDLAASLLARELGADSLIILTDIDRVYLDFLSSARRPLTHLVVRDAERHLAQGEFLPGSMGPKIEAAIEFLRGGGHRVIICLPEHLDAALNGEAGTTVVP